MIKKIDHINIVVSDLDKTTDFFCRLGFTVEHRGRLEGAWISSIVNLKGVKALYVQLSLKDSEYDTSSNTARYAPYPTFDLGSTLPSVNSRRIDIKLISKNQ